ncbi:DUF2157 domain-containing protein [Flavobacterium soli]|uniref:DUF2157 domain-containing protein n=1 Tax=Flavobacterium soli TaxID=344881 RepID=UPI0004224DCF|nr:DUF2157 domain-containing protein [Flavobacterium soli]
MDTTNRNVQKLLDKELLTKEQEVGIRNYFSQGIFSLRNELLFLMYLSVLLFTSGVGILIYKNIDTIGHSIILLLMLVLTAVCFFFSFKESKGFSKTDIDFENPVYNYLVLLAVILSCSFMGYIQFQYAVFGNYFEISIYISAFIALASAYYFNNKSALSIGITALVTSLGISLTPRTLINNDIYWNETLSYYGLILGLLIVLWSIYSKNIGLKKHFDLVLLTFALHLISICCIAGLINDIWVLFLFLMAGSSYFFYQKSFEIQAISIYIFTLLYGFIGFNIFIVRLLEHTDFEDFWELFIIILPVYFITSIVLFVKAIKNFNKKTNDSLQ